MTIHERDELIAIGWAAMRWPLRHQSDAVRRALRADLGMARWARMLHNGSWRNRWPLTSPIRYPRIVP